MAAAKRVRWECPNGKHAAVLGSTRPPKDATVRYCLPCSVASGRLVLRTAPALERKRANRTAAVAARRQTKAERDRERKAAALLVPVIDADGIEFVLDAGELLREAWNTDELRSAQREARETFPRLVGRAARPPVPELAMRKGRGRAPRRELPLPEGCAPIRQRDTLSGHAEYGGYRITMTAGPGLGHEWLRAIIVHEAAHAACPLDTRHGPRWRTAYIRAVHELYGVMVPNEGANWQLDEAIAQAIFDARRA